MDAETLRDAMRSWTTGVGIISARTTEARHGMTVNSFTSVSLDPPLVLVCIQNDLRILPLIRESGAFAISVLGAGNMELSNRFAGRSTEYIDRFESIPTRTAVTGSPILAAALAYFDCQVEASYPAGTHTIIVGRVLEASREEGAPLVYWNRGYRDISDSPTGRQDLLEAFDHWRHDSLHQLGLIQSWAQLLLEDEETPLPELARTAFESILGACQNAVAQWSSITDNLHLRYPHAEIAWKPIQLERTVPAALQNLKASAGIDNVGVSMPERLPPVRSSEYLSTVIETLVALKISQQTQASRSIEILPVDGTGIRVRCAITAQLPEFTQRLLFHPGSEFESARFFIRQHGSELLVTHSEQGTGFEFTLPVWRDEKIE